jgi:hypothetical protein
MAHKFNNVSSKPKSTNRHLGNDVVVANSYVAKARSSQDRGLEFSISFTSFKNMCRARKCYFTGLPLTPDTFTIDRIDASKGYVTGNVVACHQQFNNLKSLIENKQNQLNMEICLKGLIKTVKRIGE